MNKWTYKAIRRHPEDCGVDAWVEFEKEDVIEMRPLHHFVKHSPTGFEMGDGGSGPADLAYSILMHWWLSYKLPMEEAEEEAAQSYQEFKRVFVSKQSDRLEIRDDEIWAWLTGSEENKTMETTATPIG